MEKGIRLVGQMPDFPSPFEMRDWKQVAWDFDCLVFDEDLKGDFLPIIWMDEENYTFGIPSYICAADRHKGCRHEGITNMAAVLCATLAGIDKSAQKHDYVSMCECYFSEADGIALNNVGGCSGNSGWYDTYSSMLMTMLALCYPDHLRLQDIRRSIADKYKSAVQQLSGNYAYTPNFNLTAYDFRNMRPVCNGRWLEPEAAAGMAWINATAYSVSEEPEYLTAAKAAMQFLEETPYNPYYEIQLPFAATLAAKLNAMEGCQYNVDRIINWCFDGNSRCRYGWGVSFERWGNYDCHGLASSFADCGYLSTLDLSMKEKKPEAGYAFAMNTFSMLSALLPLCKYDKTYAHDISKWALNALNAARLFYPKSHDARHQSSGFWHGDPYNCLAYEGLRKRWDGQEPYATGDPIRYAWDAIDIGIYGSAHVGIAGGVMKKTEVEGIVQLDLNRTDFGGDVSIPAYLYFNPHSEEKWIDLQLQKAKAYDVLSEKGVDDGRMRLLPRQTALIRVLPDDGRDLRRDGCRLLYGDSVIDYQSKFPLT